ncbi:hypothetical protein PspLS_00357 [Pyricularia sp. CBS 133598]|nr:hypothetical protein PspLS_00357 [Pyricularia sp. CBS 133598]
MACKNGDQDGSCAKFISFGIRKGFGCGNNLILGMLCFGAGPNSPMTTHQETDGLMEPRMDGCGTENFEVATPPATG